MDIDGVESRINFIPCIKWVKKGVANPNPTKVQLSKAELVNIIKETKEKLNVTDDAENEDEHQPRNEDEFNFENYDEENESNTASLLGLSSLAELPNEASDNFSESDDSDKEDDVIKNTDNLILVGHVEGDASMLEVYVYNEAEESLYVHHDILLPSFPLCLEWLNYEPNMPNGNYCAIGSMNSVIEVWDIDIMNCIEPAFKLGKLPSRKKNRERIGHKDAVLSLAWNKTYDHVLASGSVDKTIILWDMENKMPSTVIKAFSDKVQCLEWHKSEGFTLLAGGCDGTVKVFDCRTPDSHQSWAINGEAETLMWNPLEPSTFMVGTSNGIVQCFDYRKGQIWSLKAHDKEITGLSISTLCSGLMVTVSPDSLLKTWDFKDEDVPVLVHEKDFKLGVIHSLDMCPDLPFVFAVGGDNKENNFCVYDLQNIDPVRHRFGSRSLVQSTTEENMEEISETNL